MRTLLISLLGLGGACGQVPTELGAATIRAPLADSEIVLTTTARCAGAIHSLTWRGREFVDSADHGRQIQSALNADCGTPIFPETFNPTEAGSGRDSTGDHSTSRVLHLLAGPDWLQSTTQMAFWLAPDQASSGHSAKNTVLVSEHLLTKRVRIGYRDLANVLPYEVTFSVPLGERHRQIDFESVTAYMPAAFSKFWAYDHLNRELLPLSDGPGEQARPVVIATPDGAFALGIFSATPGATYGRFRFAVEQVVKWNCVTRMTAPTGETLAAGEYRFSHFLILGDLRMVQQSLEAMMGKAPVAK